jgi:hypothetical protein
MLLLWSVLEAWMLVLYLRADPDMSGPRRFVLLTFILPVVVLPLLFVFAMEVRRVWKTLLLGAGTMAVMAWEWLLVVRAILENDDYRYGDRGLAVEPFEHWADCAEVYAFLLPLVAILLLARCGAGMWHVVARRRGRADT